MRWIRPFVVAGLAAYGAVLLTRRGTPLESWIVGAGLLAVGLPLLVRARREFAAGFSASPREQPLVTHGLYARIPHPMYVFLDVTLMGGIVAMRRAWLLVPWGLLLLVQAIQAWLDSRILEDAFGDDWRDYRRRTWW